MISLHVPAMRGRRCVRAISARVNDVPGVQTLAVDVATGVVRVTGPAELEAVAAAIRSAGYDVAECADTSSPARAAEKRRVMDTFATAIGGLPEATRPQLIELADGESLQLRPGPVAKRLGGTTVRMLGYNGSIPGPTLLVRQGTEVTVHVTNAADIDTTVHWHGLRLDNRYDGVPHDTQAPGVIAGIGR